MNLTTPIDTSPLLPCSAAGSTSDLPSALRERMPHVFTEGGIDFDKLKLMLGGAAASMQRTISKTARAP